MAHFNPQRFTAQAFLVVGFAAYSFAAALRAPAAVVDQLRLIEGHATTSRLARARSIIARRLANAVRADREAEAGLAAAFRNTRVRARLHPE